MASRATFGADLTGAFASIGTMSGTANGVRSSVFVGSALNYTHARMAQSFDETLDNVAKMAPKQFHHVYEWNLVGVPQGRLWRHTLRGRGRNRAAGYEFRASKMPVPVPRQLTTPGTNNKTVREGVHIFVWKAPIMEYGLSVTISPKHSEYLVFVLPENDMNNMYEASRDRSANQNQGIVFTRGTVRTTPGRSVMGNFTAFYSGWWAGQGQEIFDREIRKELEEDLNNVQFTDYIKGVRSGLTGNKTFSIATASAGRGANSRAFKRAQEEAERHFGNLAGRYDKQAAARRRIIDNATARRNGEV